MKNTVKQNPLQLSWNILSSIGGTLGLVSIVEDYFQWKSFINEILNYYQLIVYGLFEWLPFNIKDLIKDYLFLGVIVFGAVYKTYYQENFKNNDPRNEKIKWIIYIFFFSLLLWPLKILVMCLKWIYQEEDDKEYDHFDYLRFFRWIGAIILMFILIIIINMIIKHS